MSWVITPSFSFDPDAAAYIAAVEAADTQALETNVRYAINNFVIGCKQDGIWSAIKASCVLAGARTLAGALVPLVGTAPNKFGTEGGWNYSRETGLQGNGTNNYIDSGRPDDADGQNNKHYSVYVPNGLTVNKTMLGGLATSPNRFTQLLRDSGGINFALNAANGVGNRQPAAATGLIGASRSGSTQITSRLGGSNSVDSLTSTAASNQNIFLCARNLDGTASVFESKALAFYSIGESLDLALLDTRVTTLINAFDAAI